MRDSKASLWLVRNSSGAPVRALRLAAVALGIGLVMATGVARAQDDDDSNDDRTFEEKIIDGLMKGLGGTNMDSHGIDYRERSPLVVPPKLDLPPPVNQSAEVNVPNWPKDPDEARRKAYRKARAEEDDDPDKAVRTLSPSELNKGRMASKSDSGGTASSDSLTPGGNPGAASLSPSQLGFSGGLYKMFHGNTSESTTFKGEPTRESLTQPPVGYQTPSPNFAYGDGPMKSLNKEYNPAAGKYGDTN
ncbi:MAG TPA: hypothetical protein VHB49_24105 [Bradyrhizobium sp.]|nr:hypothetical protein [Bradyrhizobium sp.]